jgi:hypothetical protein
MPTALTFQKKVASLLRTPTYILGKVALCPCAQESCKVGLGDLKVPKWANDYVTETKPEVRSGPTTLLGCYTSSINDTSCTPRVAPQALAFSERALGHRGALVFSASHCLAQSALELIRALEVLSSLIAAPSTVCGSS